MNELQQIIRAEIESNGPMTCARFMELALYHPEHGYYEKRSNQVGRSGDFITSVSVGDLFGRLLAERFVEWLRELEQRGVEPPFQLVEAGAHQGQLAADILATLQERNAELYDKVEYVIIEPSERRRPWQREFLKAWSEKITWWETWQDSVYGVVFSNELLDAFPVHRYRWHREANRWRELAVSGPGWCEIEAEFPFALAPDVIAALPDRFEAEFAPQARTWYREAAGSLKAGWLTSIDYGFDSEVLVSPNHPTGTLRAYQNHQHADDLLAWPGEQDLTAHVNWAAIRSDGEEQGLTTTGLIDQSRFLTQILADATAGDSGAWQMTPKEIRRFQMLTHPDHLGHKFQVLVQQR